MKPTHLFVLTLLFPTLSYASNAAVEAALAARPDLSEFYRAAKDSGVLDELSEGRAYTVLAPVNWAMEAAARRPNACFNLQACRNDVTAVLRYHFVPGMEDLTSSGRAKGGMFSLGDHFLAAGEPTRNVHTVAGQRILNGESLPGVMLYRLDGVIPHRFAAQMKEDVERTTTVTRTTIPSPSCGPEGCPDAYSETTIVTRHVPDSADAPGQ